MKRISLWILVFTFAVGAVRAQDAATQQQMDKLSGQIKDLTDTVEVQRKRIETLEKDINELRDKVNTPAINDSASREDLKKLAEQVQEIDRKRADDRELILKNLEKVAKAGGDTAPVRPRKPAKPVDDNSTPTPATPQNGYEYPVKAGDSLGAIAKAYRDQGVKVTTAQILKANPGLDPNKLYVGKKIFIPDPSAK
jgi:LysM repeat protein